MIVIDTETTQVHEARRRRTSGGTFGALGLLVRRRMLRDRMLVLASVLIVALATFLSYSAPELVDDTIDRGAADAVSTLGDAANIRVTVPMGNPSGDNVTTVRGMPMEDFEERAAEIYASLPPRTKAAVEGYEAWIESPTFTLTAVIEGDEWDLAIEEEREPARTSRGGQYLTFASVLGGELSLLDGAWPEEPEDPEMFLGAVIGGDEPRAVEVTVSPAFAEAFDVEIGQVLVVARATSAPEHIRIVGISEPENPDLETWARVPWVTEPRIVNPGEPTEAVRGTVIADIFALHELTSTSRSVFTGTMVAHMVPERVTLATSRAIARELDELPQKSDTLLPGRSVVPRVFTGVVDALEEYPDRARAAMAQMSVVIAGVVAVAAVVIALMAQLMLSRRETDVALERARGASIRSVGLRLLVEGILIAAAGVALGYGAASLITPGVPFDNSMAILVALTAMLASPILGVLLARRLWAGRREPANRQDRAKLRKAGKARRLTLDALALVVGALAVISVRTRGVLQTSSQEVDPFLAAAPVLVGLAAVVLVLRLYPLPMKIVQFFARRTRGVGGVIALAKARQPIPALPLLALTLAVAVAISGGLMIATVRAGQETASWERVGADARIESELAESEADTLRDHGMIVSRAYFQELATLAFGSQYEDSTLFAVDEHYDEALLAAGVEEVEAFARLEEARAAWTPGDPIPAIADPLLIDMDVYGSSSMYVGRTFLPIQIIGAIGHVPEGWAGDGTYIFAPLDLVLDAEKEQPVVSNISLVTGANAGARIDAETEVPLDAVILREAWLERVQESALIGGVERAMALAVGAVAILAGVGLLVTVLRGVTSRGRALAMLRTQGMGTGWGWWLALTELAPAVLAALVGGAAAGVATVQLLGNSLGLEVLAGGLSAPTLTIDWRVMGLLGAGIVVLLFAAVAVEVAAHRRNRLSDVLRYGETREG